MASPARALPALVTMALAVGLLTSALSCSLPQPGCTRENCKAMVEACRVEFLGAPAEIAECTGFDKPTTPVDWDKYCVDACNAHAGNGDIADCIARRADACRDAGFVNLEAAYATCLPTTSQGPEAACEAKCATDRTACDTRCSGGKPCDDCLRRGGGATCASVCTDAGYQTCLDCSGRCGVDYVHCADGCPRAP